VQAVLAFCLLLFGLVQLGRARIGPLREIAQVASRLRASNGAGDGAPVRLTGAIATSDDDRVDDADYVWPGRYVTLERVIEGALVDDDGDAHWESRSSCRQFSPRSFRAHAAVVGGMQIDPEYATFVDVKPIVIAEADARSTRERPMLADAAFEPAYGGFYVPPASSADDAYELMRNGVSKNISCLLTYQGICTGDVVTVIGVRDGQRLVPWTWRASAVPGIWVFSGERAPEEIGAWLVADATPKPEKDLWIGYLGMAAIGWMMLFVPALSVLLGIVSCGIEWLEFSNLPKTLGMIATGALVIFGTFEIAERTQSLLLVAAWLTPALMAAGWVRLRLGWEDEWSWVDAA
jgi:hypothetical protein